MKVIVSRYPTQDDWNRVRRLALGTEGKTGNSPANEKWKEKMLKCEHSPIRSLMFTIEMIDIPYWVSVHFCRHKYGVEHYVRSQRNDRQTMYDRNTAPQNAPVNHTMEINAPELMYMARKRLCRKASDETRAWMETMVAEVIKVCPEFAPFLVPQCAYLGRCPEMYSCGLCSDNKHMGINDYQRKAMRTASGMNYDMVGGNGLLLNGLMGLNGEAGECIDLLKKTIFQGKPLDKEHLAKELGDVAWYLAVSAQALGYDLETVFKMNIAKLEARYPNGFEVLKSENRAEGDV